MQKNRDRGGFSLALVQMLVQGGEKEANLARAERLLSKAAKGGAHIALLPECLDLGWTHPSSEKLAEPVPDGEPYRRLAAAAVKHGLYVCAGVTERSGERVYNTAVLIDPGGELRLLHRKLNELDIGHQYYAGGDRLGVVETELGVIGLMICADAFAPAQVIARSLCYMGADIILSPSAWAVSDPTQYDTEHPYGKIWRENYRPVASEYKVWIAGVSNVGSMTAGPWSGRTCIGASMVFGPDGREIVQLPFGAQAETIHTLDVVPVPRPYRGHDWAARPG